MARNFKDLSEREILALAITLEEEDSRIYADFADGLLESCPARNHAQRHGAENGDEGPEELLQEARTKV